MAYSDLALEVRGAIALLRFNRPEALNALRGQTIAELHAALHSVAVDSAVRCLVLTGSGRAFCAGRDLKEQDALAADPVVAADVAAVVEQYQELTRRLTRMDKVVICAINGVAVGIGAELAAAADLRFAAPDTRIAFPELRRALFLTNGILYRLPRLVGLSRATEWILTGRMIEAAELLASGFVSRVVAAEELVEDAVRMAELIAGQAQIPTRIAKALLNRSFELDLATTLDLEREALVRCVESDDYREGVRAFLEKREPKYRS